jgi:hypothetical protein
MLAKKAGSTTPPRSDSKEQAGEWLVVTLIHIDRIPHGHRQLMLQGSRSSRSLIEAGK